MNAEVITNQPIQINRVVKKTTSTSIIKSSLLLVGGAIVIAFGRTDSLPDSVKLTALMAGVGIFLWGTFRFIFGSKELVDNQTGKVIKTKKYTYSPFELNRLIYFIEAKNFEGLVSIKTKESDNLQLSTNHTTDGNYITFQLFEWKGYGMEKASVLYSFEGDEAQKICSLLHLTNK